MWICLFWRSSQYVMFTTWQLRCYLVASGVCSICKKHDLRDWFPLITAKCNVNNKRGADEGKFTSFFLASQACKGGDLGELEQFSHDGDQLITQTKDKNTEKATMTQCRVTTEFYWNLLLEDGTAVLITLFFFLSPVCVGRRSPSWEAYNTAKCHTERSGSQNSILLQKLSTNRAAVTTKTIFLWHDRKNTGLSTCRYLDKEKSLCWNVGSRLRLHSVSHCWSLAHLPTNHLHYLHVYHSFCHWASRWAFKCVRYCTFSESSKKKSQLCLSQPVPWARCQPQKGTTACGQVEDIIFHFKAIGLITVSVSISDESD